MSRALLPLFATLLAALPGAQNPRTAARVDAQSLCFDPAIATQGDHSVLAYTGDNGVWVRTSDGRGLDWSAPLRLDADTTGARKDLEGSRGAIAIEGDRVYVLWNDRRSGGQELYLAVSTDRGHSFAAEQRLTAPGGDTIVDWRIESGRFGALESVWVLYTQGAATQDLWLLTSHDGAQSFRPPLFVPGLPGPGLADIDDIDVGFFTSFLFSNSFLYVAWQDDRTGTNRPYYAYSGNDGLSFSFEAALGFDLLAETNGDLAFSISPVSPSVAVCWTERVAGTTNDRLVAEWFNLQGTGGVVLGSYAAGIHDVDNPVCRISPNGNTIVVAWEDDRTGTDEIYALWSSNRMTFANAIESPISLAPGAFPRLAGDDRTAVVEWTGSGFPDAALASISHDGGQSWQLPVTLSQNTGDVDFAECAYNSRYDNLISAWLADDLGADRVYAGGFRAASVFNNGWGGNGRRMSFELRGFDPGDVLGIVSFSLGNGPLILPRDGRDLGLTADGLFLGTLAEPIYSAGLNNGAGITPILPNVLLGLPPLGITVNYVAFGLGIGSIGRFGRITDRGSFGL